MRRVLIYAAIYGSIGVLVGVCVALYTRDIDTVPKGIVLKNGSPINAGKSPAPAQPFASTEVGEPTSQSSMEESD